MRLFINFGTMHIQATKRNEKENLKDIRAEGKIPAVVYGPSAENQLVSVGYQEFRKLIAEAKLHKIFDLEIEGKTSKVLVKDYDLDKVYDTFIHVDFYVIDEKQKVVVKVPVSFEGTSEAMKVGAILTVAMPMITVKCFPQDIPEKLVADISLLKTDGDKIRVSDLQVSDKVELQAAANVMIAKAELSRAAKKAAGAA